MKLKAIASICAVLALTSGCRHEHANEARPLYGVAEPDKYAGGDAYYVSYFPTWTDCDNFRKSKGLSAKNLECRMLNKAQIELIEHLQKETAER
jgi:hypothetical protein